MTITDPSGSRVVECARQEVVVGRRDGADVQIQDAAASRNHCVLRVEGRRVQVIDLGSANGIHVGGRRVSEATLAPGQELRIGHTVIRVDGAGLTLEDPTPAAGTAPAPTPHGVQPDFGRELRGLVSRTPWYIASLAVHLLAIFLMSHVPFLIRLKTVPARIEAVVPTNMAEVDTTLNDIEPEMPARPEEVIDDRIEEDEPAPEKDSATDLSADLDTGVNPDTLGAGAKLTFKLSKPLNVGTPNKDGGERVDQTNLDSEHKRAKKAVEQGMGSGLRALRGRADKDAIVVIAGDYDNMEHVLDLYRVDYTLVTREDFARRKFPKAKVLCINCGRRPTNPREITKLTGLVERFVRNGGWLITSDWAIEPYVLNSWPELVKKVSPKQRQRNTRITVEQATASPLLASVFPRRAQTQWWLEDTSVFFKLTSARAVPLVTSEEMNSRYGASTVVFEFRSGQGRVLHLLGHFWQKDGNRNGLVAMHSLIINFLSERFRP